MLNKKMVKDIDVKSKRVLVRCDFNVPLDMNDSSIITSDKRIVASLETINYLINEGAKVILCSHIGKTGKNLSLKPVAKRLSELLGKNVELLVDVVGPRVEEKVMQMKDSDVVLLENLRLFTEEEANDLEFAKKLANLAEIFVFDAFGTAHRAHASTEGVTHYIPAVGGFLIEKEISALDNSLNNPKRPLLTIIGGAKISSKINIINAFIEKADVILVCGAMAYTFIKAQGYSVGTSLCEDDKIEDARNMLQKAEEMGKKMLLPIDNIVADQISEEANTQIVDSHKIPDGFAGVDIGPQTVEIFKEEIEKAGTIIWNGTIGIFEIDKFSEGTRQIANEIADSNATSIVGGGDSAAAVEKLGLESKMTNVSTGGGATLEFIEGKALPGIMALEDK